MLCRAPLSLVYLQLHVIKIWDNASDVFSVRHMVSVSFPTVGDIKGYFPLFYCKVLIFLFNLLIRTFKYF